MQSAKPEVWEQYLKQVLFVVLTRQKCVQNVTNLLSGWYKNYCQPSWEVPEWDLIMNEFKLAQA